MYTLHIANKNYSSWSLRPWVLMRMLDIPFEERLVMFIDGPNWERFRSFSPNGRVPCLHDGKTVVWDSLAIVEYLAERHFGVWPEDATVRAWARSAAAEMHSGFGALRSRCSMSCGQRVKLHELDAELMADVRRIAEIWAEGQARFAGPYLAGPRFTAVDAFFCPVAFRAQTYGLPLTASAKAYRDMLLGLPVMREWYDAGVAETSREVLHEQEIAAVGTIIADYRAKAQSV